MRTLLASGFLVLGLAAPAAAVPSQPLVLTATPSAPASALTLESAIQRAIATHPDILSADAQLQSATLGVEDAQAQRIALTAAVSSLGRHAASGLLDTSGAQSISADTATANTSLSATLPLFTGFKINNGILAANHREAEASAQREATRADLVYQVSKSFWELYRQEALAQAQQDMIADAGRSVGLTQTSLKLGRATPMDVTRARVSLLNAQGDLLSTAAATREARTNLAKLIGLTADEVEIAPPTVVAEAPVAEAKPGKPHPKLTAAQAHADAAQSDFDVATGDRWPQIALISTYQYGNDAYDPTIGDNVISTSFAGTWDVRLSLDYNIFDLGKVERAVKRSKADFAVARSALEKARRDVDSDLALARVHIHNAYDRLSMANESSQLAAAELKWTETRYQQGYGLQLEVIDARRTLMTSLNQRIQALCDYQIARAELTQALGVAVALPPAPFLKIHQGVLP